MLTVPSRRDAIGQVSRGDWLARKQQQGKRVGHNISADHKKIYGEIETTIFNAVPKYRDRTPKLRRKNGVVLARCGRGLKKNKYGHTHEGDRWIPIRDFAIEFSAETKLQNACRVCDHNYRVLGRSATNREKFKNMTEYQIHATYRKEYPGMNGKKVCSLYYSTGCIHPNRPELDSKEFGISRGMESGLHNHCKICVKGNSSGSMGDRFIEFMPDGKVINRKRPKGLKYCVYYPGKDGVKCNGDFHDDHIWPLAVGGSDHLVNHQWLCAAHNQAKSSSADLNLDTIDVIEYQMLSDRFRTELESAKKQGMSVGVFHQKMRAVMTEERLKRSKLSHQELVSLYTAWKRKNNRKHDVERAARKMKKFKVQT
jgi:hypothetical protein